MKTAIYAADIAAILDKPLIGDNVLLEQPSPITDKAKGSLMFAKAYSSQTRDILNTALHSLVIAHEGYEGQLRIPHIISKNPRLDFAISVQKFFAPSPMEGISSSASIHQTARLGRGIFVGMGSVIEESVEIGEGTTIGHHVVVGRNVKIGHNCVIKSGTIIGEKGFAFEYNAQKIPIALPHLGSVRIGDFVEIGANCTVVAGTISDTIISNHVKMDDQVHIAHNVQVGEATLITACADISGSVQIGNRVWIGSSACITNGVKIGEEAFIGIGAIVLRDVPEKTVVYGNPARAVGKAGEG